jgi:hypothetical protein
MSKSIKVTALGGIAGAVIWLAVYLSGIEDYSAVTANWLSVLMFVTAGLMVISSCSVLGYCVYVATDPDHPWRRGEEHEKLTVITPQFARATACVGDSLYCALQDSLRVTYELRSWPVGANPKEELSLVARRALADTLELVDEIVDNLIVSNRDT